MHAACVSALVRVLRDIASLGFLFTLTTAHKSHHQTFTLTTESHRIWPQNMNMAATTTASTHKKHIN